VKKVGIADTTFARVDMARYAIRALQERGTGFRLVRRTVPGIKDLAVACRQMFREEDVDLCLALGMPGRADLDRSSAEVASFGLMMTGVLEGKPILECFVHEAEATGPAALESLARRRAEEHALNAYAMLFRPQELSRHAGEGLRQGFADVGPVRRYH
jgi:riboflavin synthase